MLSSKSRKFEKNRSQSTDTSKQNDSLNKFKKQLYKLEEKPESSQLPDLPHKTIEDLIKAEEKKKKDFGEAFSKLLEHIKEVEGEIEQILKNERLSRKDSVNEQLKVIEKYPYLMDLIQND